jgi:hypothetical protein
VPGTGARLGRTPLVERIGLALLVALPVRDADELEPVALVEAARALVLLEDPEREAGGTAFLRLREQQTADALVLPVGLDVDLEQLVGRENREAEDAVAAVGDPHLVIGEEPGDEGDVLLGRVELWDVRHPVVSRAHHPGNRRHVLGFAAS